MCEEKIIPVGGTNAIINEVFFKILFSKILKPPYLYEKFYYQQIITDKKTNLMIIASN